MWQFEHGLDARWLMRGASIGALLLATAGCSDGFSRLDTGLTTASVSQPSNQDLIIRKQAGAQPSIVPIARQIDQPYPGDLPARSSDYGSTGSVAVRVDKVDRSALPISTGSIAKSARPSNLTNKSVPTQAFVPSVPKTPAAAASAAKRGVAIGRADKTIPIVPPLRSGRKATPTKPVAAAVERTVARTAAVPSPRSAKAKPQAQAERAGTYTVVSGDTVYGIARRAGVPPQDLVRWNALADSAIQPGQVLVLDGSATKPAAAKKVRAAVASPKSAVREPASSIVTGSVAKAETPDRVAVVAPTAPKVEKPAKKKVASTGPSFKWPARGRIVSRFGDTLNGSMNDGVDLEMPLGTPVRAVADGNVVFAASLEGYGNLVLVRHSDNWVSAYAHGSAMKVQRGQKVSQGQTIALSGKSGSAASPRLHFELRRNSTPVDPVRHLPK